MAILKHIANKNADYSTALTYLLFQHDESKNPVLDEKGRMMLRGEYYLNGINCEPMMFDKECEMLNAKYHKNMQKRISPAIRLLSVSTQTATTALEIFMCM